MSLCAKPLLCDTPFRVPGSQRLLENYSLIKNQSLLRSLFIKDATYFKFANVSAGLWGWTRFLRASGASEQRVQFPSYTCTLYCVAWISCYYLILSEISDLTLHCTVWKYITIYVKLCVSYKLLSVGNSIKSSASSGCCEYFNDPMCPTAGLWHTFTRPALAALARKL